jgi:hypothetical protein
MCFCREKQIQLGSQMLRRRTSTEELRSGMGSGQICLTVGLQYMVRPRKKRPWSFRLMSSILVLVRANFPPCFTTSGGFPNNQDKTDVLQLLHLRGTGIMFALLRK